MNEKREKKIKKEHILITIMIVILFSIYFFQRIKHPYGNDKESIIRMIKSIEGYENGTVKILDIKDIKNNRIVGFLTNNNPAYIQFIKNSEGNYEWKNIERQDGESFASFPINIVKNGSTILKFLIITNQENEIAKMELGVNEHIIKKEINVHQNSSTWIDLPKPKDNSYTFTYKYFDKNGKPIVEH